MSSTGILNDFEDHTARINNEPISMFDAAAGFCSKYFKDWKGKTVEFEVRDGKISKIWLAKNDTVKLEAAGFNTPSIQGNNSEKTSPETHACNSPLKTVFGKISAIVHDARTLTVWNEDFKVMLGWSTAQDETLRKFKQWDRVKATYEVGGNAGTDNKLIDIKTGGASRERWQGQARNDKAIILQTCLKVAADVRIARGFCESDDPKYADQMAEITAEAIKAADALSKAGGV